ncbi:hypothetical protein VKT23_020558 [Stygiomarasmius scandens]|uniref:Uncharacterized protein n=1 Tax=Marasmiellus scandens TaxID=2682957 RepID=A0ABR1IIT0_9AGAR
MSKAFAYKFLEQVLQLRPLNNVMSSSNGLIRCVLRSGASFGEWIPTAPSFDLQATIERVLIAREDRTELNESTDHLHHHFGSLSLSTAESDPISNPTSHGHAKLSASTPKPGVYRT